MNKALELESHGEPPSKKARRLSEESAGTTQPAEEEDTVPKPRAFSSKKKDTGKGTEKSGSATKTKRQAADSGIAQEQVLSDIESEIEQASVAGENNDDTVASVNGDADG